MNAISSPAMYKTDETHKTDEIQQASLNTTIETKAVALAALVPPQVNVFQRNWRFWTCPGFVESCGLGIRVSGLRAFCSSLLVAFFCSAPGGAHSSVL